MNELKIKYAGSIDYDDDDGEWTDDIIWGNNYKDFIYDMKKHMKKRKNSNVFFAAKYSGQNHTERDITSKVKADCA